MQAAREAEDLARRERLAAENRQMQALQEEEWERLANEGSQTQESENKKLLKNVLIVGGILLVILIFGVFAYMADAARAAH